MLNDVVNLSGLEWQLQARCAEADPECFYPQHDDAVLWRAAKRFCKSCEVKAECLEWALENNETWGVWGGTSPTQRVRIRKERGLPELVEENPNGRLVDHLGRIDADEFDWLRVDEPGLESSEPSVSDGPDNDVERTDGGSSGVGAMALLPVVHNITD